MPSKKKKYNARFPPARIKKIMQSDEEVGKVAQAVPVIISRALELFVESLLKKAETVTQARNAKTLTPSHLKQCIGTEGRFDFLKDLVSTVPDVQGDGEEDLAETPRSSASNTAFVYPSVPSASASSAAQGPSSNTSNEQQQMYVKQEEPAPGPSPSYLPEYAPDYNNPHQQSPGYHHHPNQHKSVIVTQQHQQSGYVLNPPGITSNPYIPSIGPGNNMYPVHHQSLQSGGGGEHFGYMQNPNGMGSPAQSTPGQGVIVYDNKSSMSHHHHYQHH